MKTALDPGAAKAALRKRLHAARDILSEADRQRFSDIITDLLVADPAYRRAGVVMAYMTFGSEFITERFAQDAIATGKTLVLPRIRRADMSLELYRVDDLDRGLAAGPWGIREPRPESCRPIELQALDYVLLPGLGFDAAGHRLGYGRGFYDRLLAPRKAQTVLAAAAFSVQMQELIPTVASDVSVDVVFTETATHRRARA